MEAETVLFWDLRSQGHTLFFDTEATAAHVNFSRWSVWLPMQWHLGRVFAHTRALDWPLLKRVAFALACPLLPALRLTRIIASARKSRLPGTLVARVVPPLILALTLEAVAQAAGTLFGSGSSLPKLTALEFHRLQVNAS